MTDAAQQEAGALSAGERAFTAWSSTSGANPTPLMWTWSEMPESQRQRWEKIAEAARSAGEVTSPASGAVEAAADALVNGFAWSAVRADCEEARSNLQGLIDNLRKALISEPKAEGEAAARWGLRHPDGSILPLTYETEAKAKHHADRYQAPAGLKPLPLYAAPQPLQGGEVTVPVRLIERAINMLPLSALRRELSTLISPAHREGEE